MEILRELEVDNPEIEVDRGEVHKFQLLVLQVRCICCHSCRITTSCFGDY